MTEASQMKMIKSGFQKAKVLNYKGRDACDFVLELENGEHLEPDYLANNFQIDGQKVWVKYQIRKDVESICMMGKMVKVIEIKKRDE